MAVWFLRDNSTGGTVGNGTIGWSAVTKWTANTVTTVGTLRRQNAPTLNSERVFVCFLSGTTGASEPAWILTKGASTTDGTVSWRECTGNPGVNNAIASVPASASVRSVNPGLGRIIKNDPGTHLYICNIAGTTAASVTLNTTIGGSTADGGASWICFALINAYANWAAPHARLNPAGSVSPVAGDDLYAASDHHEQQASLIAPATVGTVALPLNIWCISASADLSGGPSGLTSDPYSQNPACAQMTSLGAFGITIGNATYNNFNGWVFNCGSGASAAALQFQQTGRMERCSFRIPGTVTGSTVLLTAGDSIDCSYGTGHSGGRILNTSGRRARWLAGTAPSVLTHTGLVVPAILVGATGGGEFVLDGLDLLNVNTTIVAGGSVGLRVIVSNCRIHASATRAANPTDHTQTTEIINCDNAAGVLPFRHERYRYEGSQTVTTLVTRTGGVTDAATGTAYAWLITANANAKWLAPFESFPMATWNTVVGSPVTVTLYGTLSGLVPNNDDIWMEVEYFGDAFSPLTSIATTTKSNYLATPTPYNADPTSTWSSGANPFTMNSTITPQQVGYIYVRVKVAKPAFQYSIDRKIYLS